ncbi:unnamed protein product [Phyllotreta striolata]|uniref:Cytochrome b5 domain-containing protein 1 n=1 Tax=Phyllotreta striolata TaxID=444603 RepID=A0A9N9TV03_PHYSR|nr:unnamed protein product [Phyllotreta striolata]
MPENWKYFAPFEVVIHNKPDDCWVSLLGKVLDVTPVIRQYAGQRCIAPLLTMAGKDVSHWFDETTGDIQHYVHPITGCRVPYCPHGPLPDVRVPVPATDWQPLCKPPWWHDKRYQIGLLTKRVRPLRIINMICPFTREVLINVCCEDTFWRIEDRYMEFNNDAECYTWRYLGQNLNMDKTMEENGICDERDKFTELGLSQNYHVPSVSLYYNDNLKYCNTEDDYCPSIPSVTSCKELNSKV